MQKYGLKDFLGHNSNLLIYGDQGQGKTSTMYLLFMNAVENGNLTFKMASPRDFTEGMKELPVYHRPTRLFLTPDTTYKLFEDFYSSNINHLKNTNLIFLNLSTIFPFFQRQFIERISSIRVLTNKSNLTQISLTFHI